MSDPERDDDIPGRDDSFDIDIEGFDDLNFRDREPEGDDAPQGEAMDLELERLIQRLDKVVAPKAADGSLAQGQEPISRSASDPRPAGEARPLSPPRPPAAPTRPPAAPPEATAILLTERLPDEEADFTAPDILGPLAAEPATVAQLSPKGLAELIERAVERGVRRALAKRQG
ncbi:MAG: hypothetical protein LBE01_00875 [Deltaproteobacteria bacterium]|jgi:hypothetical protein|nr:hypothetical protein [Deltaproteobacteria bacterium]